MYVYVYMCTAEGGREEVIFRKCLPHLFIYCVCEYPFFFFFHSAVHLRRTEDNLWMCPVRSLLLSRRVLGIELMLSGLAVGLALGPGADRFDSTGLELQPQPPEVWKYSV